MTSSNVSLGPVQRVIKRRINAQKFSRKRSSSLAFREMQIKRILIILTSVRIAKISKTMGTNVRSTTVSGVQVQWKERLLHPDH